MEAVQQLDYSEVLVAPRYHRGVLHELTAGAIIRSARPEDAPQAARLMYLTAPALALTIFGGGEANVVRIFRELFPIPNHIYSHSHAFLAEWRGTIAGLLFGFDRGAWEAAGRGTAREIGFKWFRIVRPSHLPRKILAAFDLAWAFQPPSEGDYLIQMLAVLPEMRRQGIGTQLMAFAADQARSKGLKRLVLDVLIENEGARRFYEGLGFQAIRTVRDSRFRRRFGVQGSMRMAKPIG